MDKNGSIDLEEFKKNVLMLGIEAFDSEFTALFKLLDSDHSVMRNEHGPRALELVHCIPLPIIACYLATLALPLPAPLSQGALEHTEIKCSLRKLHEVVITATSEELRAQHSMNMKMRKTIAAHQVGKEISSIFASSAFTLNLL